jgi:hypothetical protein
VAQMGRTANQGGLRRSLLKNGDGGGDLSRPGLLRCRGGGPREAAEDAGLPVLLGGRSAQTKGSTGARGGMACRGRGGKGEKGGWGRLIAQGRIKEGGGLTARPRMEEESVGGHGAQQGARPAEAVAGRGKGGSWAGPERNSVDFDLQ